jgi:FixJ family two-component response regulator
VALYESGEELLAQLPNHAGSSCILLDIRIPGLSGPELQVHLNDMGSHLPIVFLTGHADVSTAVQVIKAGAEDLLTKPVVKDKLLVAIERAMARWRARREERDKLEALRGSVNGLTPREYQVFERVARGRLNKQIAYELGSTERTVKAHRHNLMKKLGIESLTELVLIAERLGLLAWPASTNDAHKIPDSPNRPTKLGSPSCLRSCAPGSPLGPAQSCCPPCMGPIARRPRESARRTDEAR